MMFPRWGTLFTYGRALVMRMLRWPGMGSLGFCMYDGMTTKHTDWFHAQVSHSQEHTAQEAPLSCAIYISSLKAEWDCSKQGPSHLLGNSALLWRPTPPYNPAKHWFKLQSCR